MEPTDLLMQFWDFTIPIDIIKAANVLDIIIHKTTFESMDTLAVLRFFNNKTSIELSLENDIIRNRFIVAHLIGHVALKHLTPINNTWVITINNIKNSTSDYHDKLGNNYALELLMPRDIIEILLNEIKGDNRIEEMSNKLQVSPVALVTRLKSLGIL